MFKVSMKHQIPNITHLYEGTGRQMRLKLRRWLLRCIYSLPHRVGHLHQIWLWKYNFVSRRFFLKTCFRATSDLSSQWTAKLEVSSADTYKKITVQIERLASRRTMNPHRHTVSEEKQLSILQRLAPPSGLIFVEWDSHSSGIMSPKHTSKPWRTT